MAVADAELGAPLRIPMELLEAGRLDDDKNICRCIFWVQNLPILAWHQNQCFHLMDF